MASRPVIEELPSSSDDDSVEFGSVEDKSVSSEEQNDPLADFETVNADAERQSRDAAAAGQPIDLSNAVDMTEKKEEVLEVEVLPEEETQEVRCFFPVFPPFSSPFPDLTSFSQSSIAVSSDLRRQMRTR